MHELGITRNVVAIVSERAGNRRVQRVQLQIGRLSAVLPEAIRFCFDVCSRHTVLDGATLDIVEVPGRLQCEDCGRETASEALFGTCACGSRRLRCIAGQELLITEMELRQEH